MSRSIRLISLMSVVCLFVASISLAETTAPESPEPLPVDSVERLAKAVENLSRILEKQTDSSVENKNLRKLDIAISYLNFRSRRIELMERDLNMSKNELNRYQDGMNVWSERIEQINRDMAGKSLEEQKELEQRKAEMEMRFKGFEQRISNIEEDIIIQENQISELMGDLGSVEDYIQQHLDL